jgi:hypothetical protein
MKIDNNAVTEKSKSYETNREIGAWIETPVRWKMIEVLSRAVWVKESRVVQTAGAAKGATNPLDFRVGERVG